MHGRKAEGLSVTRTDSEYGLASKAAEGRRTPRRWRVGAFPWQVHGPNACGI